MLATLFSCSSVKLAFRHDSLRHNAVAMQNGDAATRGLHRERHIRDSRFPTEIPSEWE